MIAAELNRLLPEWSHLTDADWAGFADWIDLDTAIGEYQWSTATFLAADMNTPAGDLAALRALVTASKPHFLADLTEFFGPLT